MERQRVEHFSAGAVLPPDQFVAAFVAKLVERGWKNIAPNHPATRRGLSAVVDLIDEAIEDFEEQEIDWKLVAPWVRTVNSLRPSSLGGIESWEHHFKAAQDYMTRISNPGYVIVDFAIGTQEAKFELSRLTNDQACFVQQALDTFEKVTQSAEAP